ncbi:MAG: hypothetical protein KZQ84_13100, partial [Candidatus Thiodiazotropha sp. (ex Lucinoma borealis)]|nr:hypothetical protein [Candidatus Thiodiazotropha sp. (ex Lucinoma borealis)]
ARHDGSTVSPHGYRGLTASAFSLPWRSAIEGLGDEAYLEKESSGSFKKINVLVKGDFMLDTRANTLEEARGLTELALKRLTGKGR